MAFWLKAAGFQPTLIEQASAPRRGGYVLDFWGLGYDIAERMGLIEEINRAGYHIRDMRIVDAKGGRISGFGTSVFLELTGGHYLTVGRSVLSQLLLKTVNHEIEVIFGDKIIEIDDQQTCVAVRLNSGAERRFDFVVGADGLHSGVRRLMLGLCRRCIRSARLPASQRRCLRDVQ
jgi:2-polyprenyl-6-methoxyphenol hydroxylase-like FAD-dependent oxidoreductase